MKTLSIMAGLLLLSACATFRGPPGPKLYDNIVLVTMSENVLLVPQSIEKEFIRVMSTRQTEFSQTEVAKQGDLRVVPACGPRTMKVTQDITGVAMSDVTKLSYWIFRPTATKTDEVRVTINTTVEDCETGKRLGIHSESENGTDPASVLSSLASSDISIAYSYQRAPRP